MEVEFARIGMCLAAMQEKWRCGGHERRWKDLWFDFGLEEEEEKKGKLKDLGRKGLEKEEKWEAEEEEKFLQQLIVCIFFFGGEEVGCCCLE